MIEPGELAPSETGMILPGEWVSLTRRFLNSPNIPSVLFLAAGAVHELLHAEIASVCITEYAGGPGLCVSLDPNGAEVPVFLQNSELVRQVLVSAEPLVFNCPGKTKLNILDASIRKHGIQACIAVPLPNGVKTPGGVLAAFHSSPVDAAASENEINILYAIAAQASMAIRMLRAVDESRRREQELSHIVDTAHLLISTLNMEDLLQQVAIRIAWVTGMTSCAIYSYEDGPPRIRLLAHYTSLGERKDSDIEPVFYLDEHISTRKLLMTNEPQFVSVSDPAAEPSETSLLRKYGMGTLLAMPLMSAGNPVGLLKLYSPHADHKTTGVETKRLRALSEHMALALVNTRRYMEEKRARLTADTLRQATAALSSSLELDEVLDLILEGLQQVVFFDSASLTLLDDGDCQVVAVRGHPFPQDAKAMRYPIYRDPLSQDVVSSRETLIIPDVQKDSRCRKLGHTRYLRSWMCVPLIIREVVIGLLSIDNVQENAYTKEDADVAQAFAAQAALAVANARLFESEKNNLILAEVMSEISLALSSSLKAADLLEALLVQIERVVPYDSASIMLVEGQTVRIAGQRGFDQFGTSSDVESLTFNLPDTPNLQKMADERLPYVIPDVSASADWVETGLFSHIHSWVGAPLVAHRRLLGFLSLDKCETDFYTDEHASRLQSLSRHASLALLNAITYGEVEEASITDFLTGTFNHRYFQQVLRMEWERSQQVNSVLSLLLLDLDSFKGINDNAGHIIGDRVLRELSVRFQGELRTSDMLARYGGDEFAVILPNTPLQGALLVAERLRVAAVRSPVTIDGTTVETTISIGAAASTMQAGSVSELIAAADKALYLAKSSGKNCIKTIE